MKISAISAQLKNRDRVNVSVDGKYRFSLDLYQVVQRGLRVGNEYSEAELLELEQESIFGKVYARTLEYCLMRPHSSREVRDYLWRKTRSVKRRNLETGEVTQKPGIAPEITDRVMDRLIEKGYVDDEKFARFWVENRNQTKGISMRKLTAELRAKGVETVIIDKVMHSSTREEKREIIKVIAKKGSRYPDQRKLIAYLAGQGFSYGDIRSALDESETDE